MERQKGSVKMTAIVIAVVALGLGVFGSTIFRNAKNTDMSSNPTAGAQQDAVTAGAKSSDLRKTLNLLEGEHISLATAATRNGFDGNADFDATAKSLDANSVDLAKAVGSVYGADAEAKFLEIWRSHITFFVNYTVAAKKGDQAGMDKAAKDLGGYIDAISDFFSGANPNLPREAVKQLITEHVGILKGAVDAHGAKNYTESYAKQREAVTQVGTIADTLSGAIVKQKPEMFQ